MKIRIKVGGKGMSNFFKMIWTHMRPVVTSGGIAAVAVLAGGGTNKDAILAAGAAILARYRPVPKHEDEPTPKTEGGQQ